jgi:copper resistance protein D
MYLFIRSIPTWFELVSLAFCIGSLTCGLWVLAPGAGGQNSNFRRTWAFFSAAVALMAIATVVDLVLRTAEMSGNPLSAVVPLLPAVILKTHFGAVWLIRMACLLLVGFLLTAGKKYRHTPAFSSVLLLIAAVIAFTESASGHAADTGDFTAAEVIDFLHLAGALIWGGGLFTISLLVLPTSITGDGPQAQSLVRVVERFSRTAGVAVAVIVATSLYNAWVDVGSLDALFKSPYGKMILAKIVFFVLLLALAAFNRSISVPRLQEWAGLPAARPGVVGRCLASLFSTVVRNRKKELIAPRFLRTVRIEAFLMLGLLFCVAVLRHEIPARHFAHLNPAHPAGEHPGSGHEGHMHHAGSGPAPLARLETNPAHIVAGAPVVMNVHLESRDRRPFEGLIVHHERILHAIIIGEDLSVFAHIHPEDLGPVTDEMVKKATFPLRFTFPKAGKYLIGFDFATEDGQYSNKAYLSVSGGPAMTKPEVDQATEKNFGTYHVSLKHSPANIKTGADTLLRFFIEQNGKPIKNLEPYLGAPMHLAIVRSDLTEFIHTHGFTPEDLQGAMHAAPAERFGPEIDAEIVFPGKGVYKIFSQVKHEGKVLLFDFTVRVE